jgi:hypothetical protein
MAMHGAAGPSEGKAGQGVAVLKHKVKEMRGKDRQRHGKATMGKGMEIHRRLRAATAQQRMPSRATPSSGNESRSNEQKSKKEWIA